jgi:hypothetical protein
LRQNPWAFEIIYREKAELEVGEIGLKGSQVLMGTQFSNSPFIFSWEEQMRSWSQDRDVFTGKTPLIKALGLKKNDSVIDTTLGLGKDTTQLLTFGAHVEAYERVPQVYFMARAAQIFEGFLEDKLLLNFGSLGENPKNLPIYFDPMFDDGSKRKAKAHNAMSAFHELVGGDPDAIEEGKRLRNLTKRLVVKRPSKKKALLENVNSTWKGKAISFDLYL